MTLKNRMREELSKNEIADNPFDVMMYHSLELTRDILFACHRFQNPEALAKLALTEEKLDSYINEIKKELSKLMSLSNETVSLCRETSCFYDRDKFNDMNKVMISLERDLQTMYTRSVPFRNDRFEKNRLGDNSQEYQRLCELRNLIDNSEELSGVNDNYLCSLCDIIIYPDDCVEYLMTKKEMKEKKAIIEKYQLSIDDIEYMISYKRSKKAR